MPEFIPPDLFCCCENLRLTRKRGHICSDTYVLYYDATALGSNYAVNELDFRWVVVLDCSCQRVLFAKPYIGQKQV